MIKRKDLLKKIFAIDDAINAVTAFVKDKMEVGKAYVIAIDPEMYDMDVHREGPQVRENSTSRFVKIDGARVLMEDSNKVLQFHIYKRGTIQTDEWVDAYSFALPPHQILKYIKCDDEGEQKLQMTREECVEFYTKNA